MNLMKLSFPLSAITGDAHLILLEVRPVFAYLDGKKTENQEGYKFWVVDDRNFEKFAIKIACTTPAITQEHVDASKERLYVRFENAVCKPYKTNSGDFDLSITASNVIVVKS